MTLGIDIRLQVGAFDLDVAFEVEPGELVAVLGPNGAGKSTIMRAIAGLTPIDDGHIRIGDEMVDQPTAQRFVSPEDRPIGIVFQDYLLFANMTALENVAFGLRARGTNKQHARHTAAAWLERVGLESHARHRPGALSGGQAQRVALARALAIDPRVLLLDEPLAALDAGTRSTMRRDLRQHLGTFDGMRLLVTHDPVDAYALADRVIVLESGRVVQTGTLDEVTAHPRSRYVADLVGLNLIEGIVTAGTFTTTTGTTIVVADTPPDGAAYVTIRPQAIALHQHQPEGSSRNAWRLSVDDLDERSDRARVTLAGAVSVVAEITPAALVDLDLRPGGEIWATVKATDLAVYPR